MLVKELAKKLGVANSEILKYLKEIGSDAKKVSDKMTSKEVKYLSSVFKKAKAGKTVKNEEPKTKKKKAAQKKDNNGQRCQQETGNFIMRVFIF